MTSLDRFYANEAAKKELRRISARYAASSDSPTRHKCFVSYHGADAQEVLAFVQRYENVFIPRVIGITEDDPAINSDDADYIMDTIREKYLSDSTVTILMVGRCTWSRKFIDWEIFSSLRRGRVNRLNGLMGIQLPSATNPNAQVPARLSDNLRKGDGGDAYARYWKYPTSDQFLRECIEDAFEARQKRQHLIQKAGPRKQKNSPCP
ncbi:TIR domain-containing protein [Streptomyces sp. JL3001]|uniref:TIR domain-containing protein n=1 Tax=Streptomyces sp. JL3001 TaxID=3400923 RepID=UPI003B280101